MTRHRGISLPLSSMPSSGSWGIGEIPDLVPMGQWLQAAAYDQLMLLPVGTMATGQSSPYSACSAMAIDPIYLSIEGIEDFSRAGGLDCLSPDALRWRDEVRGSSRVRFAQVRELKEVALWIAFRQFVSDEWDARSIRAGDFAARSEERRVGKECCR